LGAGGRSVRLNGRVFETVAARLERRLACDLYHSALEVRVPEGRFTIETAPIPDANGAQRGVVAEGTVGARWAGRFRVFRYEVRRCRDGRIPDVGEAVESPQRLSDDPARARWLLDLVPAVPTPVWGRDELAAGEMWNSNSVISWLIARSRLDTESIEPPARGRAPGWDDGLVLARRHEALAIPRLGAGEHRQDARADAVMPPTGRKDALRGKQLRTPALREDARYHQSTDTQR
jgi:hypothetical protein